MPLYFTYLEGSPLLGLFFPVLFSAALASVIPSRSYIASYVGSGRELIYQSSGSRGRALRGKVEGGGRRAPGEEGVLGRPATSGRLRVNISSTELSTYSTLPYIQTWQMISHRNEHASA